MKAVRSISEDLHVLGNIARYFDFGHACGIVSGLLELSLQGFPCSTGNAVGISIPCFFSKGSRYSWICRFDSQYVPEEPRLQFLNRKSVQNLEWALTFR